MRNWYERPIHRRAARGGELGFDGKFYRGGKLMPFYIPRPIMPQINEADHAEFLDFCAANGVNVVRRSISPWILHPHQRLDPFDPSRMHADDKRAFVSLDLYVLDGNHRWMLYMSKRLPMPTYQIELPFERAIELMFKFPKTYALLCHREED